MPRAPPWTGEFIRPHENTFRLAALQIGYFAEVILRENKKGAGEIRRLENLYSKIPYVATPVSGEGWEGSFCLNSSLSPLRMTRQGSPSLTSPRRIASASGSSR